MGSRGRAACQALGIFAPLLASTVPTLVFGLLFGGAVAYVLKTEMFPLIPFAVGILTGVAAVKLVRNEKAKKGLESAQERLQSATVSGLAAIEQSSARLRHRLEAPNEAETSVEDVGEEDAVVEAKPAARRRAPAKKAAAEAAE